MGTDIRGVEKRLDVHWGRDTLESPALARGFFGSLLFVSPFCYCQSCEGSDSLCYLTVR